MFMSLQQRRQLLQQGLAWYSSSSSITCRGLLPMKLMRERLQLSILVWKLQQKLRQLLFKCCIAGMCLLAEVAMSRGPLLMKLMQDRLQLSTLV
jgi:hypothetical protein